MRVRLIESMPAGILADLTDQNVPRQQAEHKTASDNVSIAK
jgi:hypothetical protein